MKCSSKSLLPNTWFPASNFLLWKFRRKSSLLDKKAVGHAFEGKASLLPPGKTHNQGNQGTKTESYGTKNQINLPSSFVQNFSKFIQ